MSKTENESMHFAFLRLGVWWLCSASGWKYARSEIGQNKKGGFGSLTVIFFFFSIVLVLIALGVGSPPPPVKFEKALHMYLEELQ